MTLAQYKPFEARRQLMAEADMYLADERIVTLLPKLLGAKWLDSRKCVRWSRVIVTVLARAQRRGRANRLRRGPADAGTESRSQ